MKTACLVDSLSHVAAFLDSKGMSASVAAVTTAQDRLEAAQRALETARRALEQVEGVGFGYCGWCKHLPQYHTPDCKRQQALTEIAGALDGEKA